MKTFLRWIACNFGVRPAATQAEHLPWWGWRVRVHLYRLAIPNSTVVVTCEDLVFTRGCRRERVYLTRPESVYEAVLNGAAWMT